MERKTVITIEGVSYRAALAKVIRTHLGTEDHGILSVNLHFGGLSGSWEQGTGHYFADQPNRMFPWVKSLLDFFGGTWEDIAGKECFVLRLDYSGQILGLVSKSDDSYVLFETIRAEVANGEASDGE